MHKIKNNPQVVKKYLINTIYNAIIESLNIFKKIFIQPC